MVSARSDLNDATVSGRKLAAWVAIASCPFAWVNIYCFLAASSFDMEAIFKSDVALTFSPASQRLFLCSMLFDSFGFYLPFLVVGGYLWSRLRPSALMNMAALCLGVYVFLGLAGTSMQFATLPVLSAAHSSGDPMAKVAAETAWLAIVHATENGLWWMEGPVMAFWAIAVGSASKAAGLRYGRMLMLAGLLYGGYFILGAVGAAELAIVLELIGLFVLPLWMLLTGIGLLRERGPLPQHP